MTKPAGVDRRRWLQRALALAGGLALSACDRIAQSDRVNSTLDVAEGWTQHVQRLLLGRQALAREYSESDISEEFRANGTVRNVPAFYSAFDVKEGDKMFLPPEKRVKIW